MLLAINSGKGHIYKGKTLEDIDVSDGFDLDSDTEHEKPYFDRESNISGTVKIADVLETFTSDVRPEKPSHSGKFRAKFIYNELLLGKIIKYVYTYVFKVSCH